jgi:hypothetical protein
MADALWRRVCDSPGSRRDTSTTPCRAAWLLFLPAGLVALDNLEFGAATFAALLCARTHWTRAALGRLAAEASRACSGRSRS